VARRKDIDGARLDRVVLPSLRLERAGVVPEMGRVRTGRKRQTAKKVSPESRAAAATRDNPRPGARGRARR